jgi:hypothetical protein
VWQRRLDAVERAYGVDLEDVAQVLRAQLCDASREPEPRVVDEDVDGAERLECPLTIASTEPASEMSVFTASARPPEAEISRRSASSFPASREASTTAAPREASSRAVASPMPLEAPVTTATRPFSVFSTLVS